MIASENISHRLPYQQVKSDILETIRKGNLKIGDRLKSITALSKEYQVAGETVRKAIGELVKENILETRGAAGTYVIGLPEQPGTKSVRHLKVLTIFGADPDEKFSSSQFKSGIMDVFSDFDINLRIFKYGFRKSKQENIFELSTMAQESGIGGVIFRWHDQVYLRELAKFPTIFCNSQFFPSYFDKASQVTCLGVESAYLATENLIQRGHTKIGLICSTKNNIFNESLSGYQAGIQDNGIQYESDLVLTDMSLDQTDTIFLKVKEWLQSNPEITAVYVDDDYVCSVVLDAVTDCNKRIPEDLSIISFANKNNGPFWRKTVTKVEIDHYQVGYTAARMLIDIMSGNAVPGQFKYISPIIIPGETVCSGGNHE